MTKKKILFISVNRHQKNYFSLIGTHLSKEYDVSYLDYKFRYYFDAFLPVSAISPALTNEIVNRIIHFSLKKGQIRKFEWFRRYLHQESTLRRIAKRVFTHVYQYLEANRIDMVCVWNGNTVERAAAMEAAKAYGAKTCFFENGLLPNTTTLDPQGVNASGILSRKPADFFRSIQIDRNKLDALFSEKLTVRAQKKRWYKKKKAQPAVLPETPDLDTPYIFVPFQVHDDTQIIIHSPYVNNMTQFTEWIAAAVRQYNAMHHKNLRIIIKEHPSDQGRQNYDFLRTQYPEITFLKQFSTEQLIEHAAAIVTVNSTVGMEALMKHKDVIALGNASYTIDGIVKRAQSVDGIVSALTLLHDNHDDELIDQFLYYIRYHYLIEGSWRAPTDAHYASVSNRIAEIMNDSAY